MTKDEAAKLIPIMQAYVDGKEIQVLTPHLSGKTWITANSPTFSETFEWRIKPREVKVKVYESPTSGRIFTVSEGDVTHSSWKFIKEVTIEV